MKEQWEELRDMAARQYEEDAKSEGPVSATPLPDPAAPCRHVAKAVHVDIDLSKFPLTEEQKPRIQNAANEYASWVAKNGEASPLDRAFFWSRIERICAGMHPGSIHGITVKILRQIAAKQPAK